MKCKINRKIEKKGKKEPFRKEKKQRNGNKENLQSKIKGERKKKIYI